MYFDNNMYQSVSIKDVRRLQKMHFAHDHKVLLGELSKKKIHSLQKCGWGLKALADMANKNVIFFDSSPYSYFLLNRTLKPL